MAEQEDLRPLLGQGPVAIFGTVSSDRTFEVRQPFLFADNQSVSIRIGISTLLVKDALRTAFNRAMQAKGIAGIMPVKEVLPEFPPEKEEKEDD